MLKFTRKHYKKEDLIRMEWERESERNGVWGWELEGCDWKGEWKVVLCT